MINNVVLVGRLTKDVDLRYTQNGIAVASFTVAVERRFKNAQGERETDFISCVMWRKAAENFAQFTRKGSLIGIEGSIQTRNYDNQQGQKVYVTEVLAENFSLLESKAVTQSRPAANDSSKNYGTQPSFENNNTDPFGQNNTVNNQNNSSYQNNENPFASNSNFEEKGSNQSMNITDDDLPF